jgi:hypothetical protein
MSARFFRIKCSKVKLFEMMVIFPKHYAIGCFEEKVNLELLIIRSFQFDNIVLILISYLVQVTRTFTHRMLLKGGRS